MRDSRQSQKIAQRMESNLSDSVNGSIVSGFQRLKFKENSIDDIGLVVVDGNFDLYGRIIFGNKKILQILGFQAEHIIGKTVHNIMPKIIAEVHNQFWRGFS